MRKIVFAVLAVAAGTFALGFASLYISAQDEKLRKSNRAIPGRYIVVLEDRAAGARGADSNAEAVAEELSLVYGGKVERVFKHALNGYVAEISDKEAEQLSKDNRAIYGGAGRRGLDRRHSNRRYLGSRPDRPTRSSA